MTPQQLFYHDMPSYYKEYIRLYSYNEIISRDISITENMLLDLISISVMRYINGNIPEKCRPQMMINWVCACEATSFQLFDP